MEFRDILTLTNLSQPARDNDGVLGVRAEAHAGHPLGVALVGDGELAVAEGVPQLDGAVTGAGDDLTVVGGEGDGEDIVGVADEAYGWWCRWHSSQRRRVLSQEEDRA